MEIYGELWDKSGLWLEGMSEKLLNWFNFNDKDIEKIKGRLRTAIFKSAETEHLIFLCYLGDAIKCAVSAALKMAAHNRALAEVIYPSFDAWWVTLAW